MQKGIFDLATDRLNDLLTSAKEKIRKDYKGVKPFRYNPPPEREQLYNYLNMTPEQTEFGRQSFGEAFTAYENQMESLRRKFNAGT